MFLTAGISHAVYAEPGFEAGAGEASLCGKKGIFCEGVLKENHNSKKYAVRPKF